MQKPLRIVLAPMGTRGDVAPLVALAHELRRRGHAVVFVAPRDGSELIAVHGFELAATSRPFSTYLHHTQSELRVLQEVFRSVKEQFDTLVQVAAGADAIVGSMLQLAAPSVAEHVGAKYFYAMFSPTYLQTTTIPVPVPLGAWKVRVTSPRMIRFIWWLRDACTPLAASALMRERARLGLPPFRSVYEHLVGGELLYAFDPELAPMPDDIHFGHPTAHWPLADANPLDGELVQFLAAGESPVYAGFGSMMEARGGAALSAIERTAEALDLRFIVGARQPERPASDRLLFRTETPHAQLLPRTRLVLHHGGAGTLATAARAGVPQLVVPHLGDQFYHGQRVFDLGIGPAPLPVGSLSARNLTHRIQAALDPKIRERAAALGRTLEARSGVARAAAIIEQCCA